MEKGRGGAKEGTGDAPCLKLPVSTWVLVSLLLSTPCPGGAR